VMDSKDFKFLAKDTIDFLVEYQDSLRSRPVFPDICPGYLRSLLPDEIPNQPESWENILPDIEKVIVPGLIHWKSPGFNTFYPSTGSYPSMIGDLLISGFNNVCINWKSSPVCSELEVLIAEWLGKLMNLPACFFTGSGQGFLNSSASEASLMALVAARQKAIETVKHNNPLANKKTIESRLVVYTSERANACMERVCLITSLTLRKVPTEEHKMNPHVLKTMITDDIENGLIPCCVIATLGTTEMCAFDPLVEIGELCQEYSIWLHVDAAYAGAAFICPENQHLLKGVEYADTFLMSCHKWLLTSIGCTAVWAKDTSWYDKAFNVARPYLEESEGINNAPCLRNRQVPVGRGFIGLKLWLVFRLYGAQGLQEHIRNDCQLVNRLYSLIQKDHRFEVVVKPILGLMAFRLKGPDHLTESLFLGLHSTRKVFLMLMELQGKTAIRYVVGGFEPTKEDVDNFWELVLEIANKTL